MGEGGRGGLHIFRELFSPRVFFGSFIYKGILRSCYQIYKSWKLKRNIYKTYDAFCMACFNNVLTLFTINIVWL